MIRQVIPRHFTRIQRVNFSSQNLIVCHSPEKSEFFVELNAEKAVLQYRKVGNVLEMDHTEVPAIFQGKGVAKKLAEEAFSYAIEHKQQMKLHCDYLQKFYKDNQQKYAKYVIES